MFVFEAAVRKFFLLLYFYVLDVLYLDFVPLSQTSKDHLNPDARTLNMLEPMLVSIHLYHSTGWLGWIVSFFFFLRGTSLFGEAFLRGRGCSKSVPDITK